MSESRGLMGLLCTKLLFDIRHGSVGECKAANKKKKHDFCDCFISNYFKFQMKVTELNTDVG